jgi:hypothetical protein
MVAVVDRSDVDVGSARPGHRERLLGGTRDRCAQHVVGVGRGLEGDVFTEAGDPHRAVATSTRDVGVGDQDPGAAVHAHHRFEHVDGVGDHRAGEDVVHRDRGPVENRARMRARVGALVDRDLGDRGGVVAELCRVALSDLRVRRVLPHVAVRDLELGLRRPIGV